MTDLKNKYADVILGDFLKLQRSDVLSINTEEKDFEFARLIALKAVEITGVPVKIVQTQGGKPVDVIEFDPEITKSAQPGRPAMLRLAHMNTDVEVDGPVLDVVVDKEDFATLQKLGHLAQPVVLDRRISVPWCSVPVYEENDPDWSLIQALLEGGSVSDSALVVDYRKKMLTAGNFSEIRISGEGTDVVFGLPSGNVCYGGSQVLTGGRSFLYGADFQKLSLNLDCNKAEGVVKAKAKILGKTTEVSFKFENGVVVSYSGPESLKRLFEYDGLLLHPGYITMADGAVEVFLGGALSECLNVLPESEEDLPDFFNRSFYSLKLVVDPKCDVYVKNTDGSEKMLINKGVFTE